MGCGYGLECGALGFALESIRVRGDSERGGGSGVLLDAPCEGRSVSLEWWFRETGAESVKALRRPSDQPIIQRTPYLHFQVSRCPLNDCSRLTHGSAVPPVPLECPDGACFLFVISDAGIPALGP